MNLDEWKFDQSDVESAVTYFSDLDGDEDFEKVFKKELQKAKIKNLTPEEASKLYRNHGETFDSDPWSGMKGKPFKPFKDPSIVISFKGKSYVIDGQHRMNQRIKEGLPVPVAIMDGEFLKKFDIDSNSFSRMKIHKVTNKTAESLDQWGIPITEVSKIAVIQAKWKKEKEKLISSALKKMKDLGIEIKVTDESHEIVIGAFKGKKQVGKLIVSDAGSHHIAAGDVSVDPAYRRKGIATAMYIFAEQHTGKTMVPADSQADEFGADEDDIFSDDARKFWDQSKRPFGESIIKIPDKFDGPDVKVFKNPTLTQAKNLFVNSTDQTLKWIIDKENNLYIWDAYFYHHREMDEKLNLQSKSSGMIENESEASAVLDIQKKIMKNVAESLDESSVLDQWGVPELDEKKLAVKDVRFDLEDNEGDFEIVAYVGDETAGSVAVASEYVGGGGDCYPFEPYQEEPFFKDICDHELVTSIQTLSVDDKFTGKGIATELMKRAMKEIKKRYSKFPVYINASPMGDVVGLSDLVSFYKTYGFKLLKTYPEHRNALLWKDKP